MPLCRVRPTTATATETSVRGMISAFDYGVCRVLSLSLACDGSDELGVLPATAQRGDSSDRGFSLQDGSTMN